MKPIPNDIWEQFFAVLKKRAVPVSRHSDCRKWLQYFLDFSSKYPLPETSSEQVRLFVQKLKEKKQSLEQQKHAAYVVSLYFEMPGKVDNKSPYAQINTEKGLKATSPSTPGNHNSPYPPLILRVGGKAGGVTVKGEPSNSLSRTDVAASASTDIFTPQLSSASHYNEWRCLKKSASPAWDKIIESLAAEIKLRHYSRKTLKTYADWSRKYQSYLRNKTPDALTADDVKEYLTYLAVNCKVAASTQNQAFNAILFLYRHILKKDFGEHKDIPRAKRSNYIPIVLSRQEIDSVLKHLPHPYNLVVKLLYGCGLRLFEGVKLRVKDFNFDAGILTVRGKGNKSRTMPVPQKIFSELTAQLEVVKKLHDKDIAAGYAGVFLEDQLEKKYPKAAKDFIWQWFFPQQSLTFVADKKEKRRYHVHEKHVQEALYEAVRRAKLTKRATSHTFRHSFATHLLQANYDIRTIQTLLGHSDVRTTMIYTHCVPSKTIKETKSPLDF